MIAKILITAPDPDYTFSAATCVLRSLRIGFPDCDVHIYINKNTHTEVIHEIANYAIHDECVHLRYIRTKQLRHDEWIQLVIENETESLVFIDPDCIFYDDVQNKLLPYEFIAGRIVPNYYNHVVEANEVARVHTSLLYVKSPSELISKITGIVQRENYPFKAFAPAIHYLGGKKFFYDTFANISQMIDLNNISNFPEHILDAYTHLGCGSMLEHIIPRLPGGNRLQHLHKVAEDAPEKLQYFWKEQNNYYLNNPVRL